MYIFIGEVSSSISSNLSDLNKTLPQGTSSSIGYIASGFEGGTYDLASIWSTKSDIINALTAHAMTTNEIEAVYAELTGTSKTVLQLDSMKKPLITSNMTFKNTTLEEKAKDLLGIGNTYWLDGSSYGTNSLWGVSYMGDVDSVSSSNYGHGVRPVVSLNSGVQIAGDNTGTGASEAEAYKLAD